MQVFIFFLIIVTIVFLIYKLLDHTLLAKMWGDHAEDPKPFTIKNLSISEKYEEMCLRHPLQYKNHPDLNKVSSDYTALIKGHIKDPEMKNIPVKHWDNDGEKIISTDYTRYLRNQIKVLSKIGYDVSTFKSYLKSANQDIRAEQITFDYQFELLWKNNIPDQDGLHKVITSEYRMEHYKPKDWDALVKAVKGYINEYPKSIILGFLERVQDVDKVTDSDNIELYDTLLDKDVPEQAAADLINGIYNEDDLEDILMLMKKGYEYETALKSVQKRKMDLEEADNLRNKYRAELISRKG